MLWVFTGLVSFQRAHEAEAKHPRQTPSAQLQESRVLEPVLTLYLVLRSRPEHVDSSSFICKMHSLGGAQRPGR